MAEMGIGISTIHDCFVRELDLGCFDIVGSLAMRKLAIERHQMAVALGALRSLELSQDRGRQPHRDRRTIFARSLRQGPAELPREGVYKARAHIRSSTSG